MDKEEEAVAMVRVEPIKTINIECPKFTMAFLRRWWRFEPLGLGCGPCGGHLVAFSSSCSRFESREMRKHWLKNNNKASKKQILH